MLDLATWTEMMSRRSERSKGFSKVEAEKGFLTLGHPFSSTRGQEILRICLYRLIEEWAESFMAQDRKHILEEQIDAFNYLATITLLEDPDALEWGAMIFHSAAKARWADDERIPYTTHHLVLECGKIGDILRNRSWMHNAQDIYFGGRYELHACLKRIAQMIMSYFPTWEEFWRFYIAKDEVLAFRIRSNY